MNTCVLHVHVPAGRGGPHNHENFNTNLSYTCYDYYIISLYYPINHMTNYEGARVN